MRYQLTIGPGVVSDDTETAKGGRWSDGDGVRFVRGRAELIGGHERIFRTDLTGVCRNAFAWYDNDGSLNLAFGTNSHLFNWKGGELTDITPTLAMPAKIIGAAPFAVTDASAVVTVTHLGHGLVTADSVVITGAVAVGRIVPNGTFAVTRINDDSYSFEFTSPADIAETLANNPLATTNLSPVVVVTDTAHAIPDGTVVTFSGASAVGGITPNGAFAITVIDANSYSFTFTADATSTASGGGASVVATVPTTGGGSAVKIAPQVAFAAGQVNGTGAYGVGFYGQPSDTEYFPRTWSFGVLGEALVASPRGGAIYLWENDTAANAEPILNSPRQNTAMITTPERVVLGLGCNEEVSGVFNPRCIRNSDPRDETVWNTDTDTLAREKVLEGAGRLVSGRDAGFGSFIFTDSELYDARYVGALDEVFSFTRLGQGCGLIGPNAATVKDQQAIWLTLDLQFMTCLLGGRPTAIECPHRDELEEHLAPVQRDKIAASTIAGRAECWFFYPDDRDGLENSRALFVSTTDGWWSKAQLARTAFIDASPALYPLGVDATGKAFWHERGQSADGSAIAWSLESAPQYIDAGEKLIYLRAFHPDFKDQQGAINLTIITREEAQSDPVEHGPYSIAPGTEVVDLDVEARLVSFRLSGESAPAYFRQGVIIFEGRQAGRR